MAYLSSAESLPALPEQPADVSWPTHGFESAPPAQDVDIATLAREATAPWQAAGIETFGKTRALLLVHRGRLVSEAYAPALGPDTSFRSWSLAKSLLHAVVGLLIGDGRLDCDAPAPVPAWARAGDPRGAIRLEQLLRMLDGLDYVEHDPGSGRSDVVEMLAGAGKVDAAAYAAALPLAHPPGSRFNYSSAASIVVSSLVSRALGGGRENVEAFARERLFEPLGMRSWKPLFDAAGTWLASSYSFCTARDFARFGVLYLRDGVWAGTRILPAGWVDHARHPTAASNGRYGAHWWLATDGSGIFSANGFRGQYIVVDPRRDVVAVRLGSSSDEQRSRVEHSLARMLACFPPIEPECESRGGR